MNLVRPMVNNSITYITSCPRIFANCIYFVKKAFTRSQCSKFFYKTNILGDVNSIKTQINLNLYLSIIVNKYEKITSRKIDPQGMSEEISRRLSGIGLIEITTG